MKTIRVKFNIMQFSQNNPQNFDENNSDHVAYLNSLVSQMNNNLLNPINCPVYNSNGNCDCDLDYCTQIGGPNDCCISDAKFQFRLEPINYVPDPMAWDCSGGGGSCGCAIEDCCYIIDEYLSDEDCMLNVFFFEPGGGTTTGCGMGYWGAASNYVFMKDNFNLTYQSPTLPLNDKIQTTATLLLHEIIHNLGLHHTNTGGGNVPDVYTVEDPDGCNPDSDPDCSNNIMTSGFRWYQNWLSPHQLGQIHRLLIGSFRSQQLLMEYDPTKTIAITQDETWDIGKVVYGDIVVYPGQRLTITCKTIMPPGGKIIVRPNAELYIDGGLVTIASNECDGYWDGIYVLGIPTIHQFYVGGQRNQGMVVVQNGGTIEYANTAIQTYNLQGTPSGGIIRCTDGIFRNNTKAIDFAPYQGWHPSGGNTVLFPNLSYFRNCTFTLDNDYRGDTFDEHVYMQEVDGIRFSGCDFSNEDFITSSFLRGSGIHAVDAHFEVLPYCLLPNTNCNDDRSSFFGFFNGIEVSMSGCYLYTYLVDRADFSGNLYGIYSRAVNNPVITRSDFNVSGYPFNNGGKVGIYLYEGTGYTVEENTFDRTTFTDNPVGVLVRNTGEADNQIRRNTFDNLYVGNLSNEENIGIVDETGLRYFCNNNNNNIFDFAVPEEPLNANDYGIASNQGAINQAAGNIFSLNGNNPESDFQNQSPNNVTYFYFNATGEQPLNFSSFVNPTESPSENLCSIDFPPNPDPDSDDDDIILISGLYWQNNFTKDSLKQVFYNSVDGGDSPGLSDQVENSLPPDGPQLKSDLLALSPWLSIDVLIEASDRTDVLSHSDQYDIFATHPEAIQNQSFLDYLNNKADPMPSNMIQSLADIPFQASAKTELEAAIGYSSSRAHQAASRATHYYLSDSTDQNVDSVRLWLGRQESLRADMAIVDSWLHEKNTTEASVHMGSIPQIHQFSPQQQIDYNHFRSLKNIQVSLINDDRCASELNSSELTQVTQIADNGTGLARMQAQNIINAYYGGSYFDEPILPVLLGGFRTPGKATPPPAMITAFPNPASGNVHFHYQLDKEYNNLSIRIFTINGELIKEIALNEKTEGYASWNISEMESGFYFYSISSNRHALSTGKLVISQ